MRILTLWEPWATLMALGKKRIETRSWSTRYRGPLAIHAAKGGLTLGELRDLVCREPFRSALNIATDRFESVDFNHGCIVAVVSLVDCVPVQKCHSLGDLARAWTWREEQAFGDYSAGRYAWITGNAFRFPRPIPHKSGQGLCFRGTAVAETIMAQTVSRPNISWASLAQGRL